MGNPKTIIPDIPTPPIPGIIAPTKHSIAVYLKNETGYKSQIVLYHKNNLGMDQGVFDAAANQTVGSMLVHFETGVLSAADMDYWGAVLAIMEGPDQGVYHSEGSFLGSTFNSTIGGLIRSSSALVVNGPLTGVFGSEYHPSNLDLNWKECQLQSDDVGKTPIFSIDKNGFHINLHSGSTSVDMKKLDVVDPRVQHIFVLMLENHSFDNIFGMSGIPGIVGAQPSFSNAYEGVDFHVQKGAPDQMPTDPGHEFEDVFEQLTGVSDPDNKQSYHNHAVNNSGFAKSYATSNSEDSGTPDPAQVGDVMKCYDTPNQLPVIYQLAREFAICDHWFSSLPGPTWPNRFFVHAADSSGLDSSPGTATMLKWESASGFEFKNGTIFDRLGGNFATGHPNWRIYQDKNGPALGSIPQVAACEGLHTTEVEDFANFKSDLANNYSAKYTFIEPNYGDTGNGTYQGGSSQHPMDGVYRGEQLIKETYEAIRNSALWGSSLLIITYDEHGGFYDSVPPPKTMKPGGLNKYNTNGFDFTQLGVRVPAVVVSPFIEKGTVDHKQYEHSSVPATIERSFGLAPMTERDKAANDVLGLLTRSNARTDCPTVLNNPSPDSLTEYTEPAIPDIAGNLNGSGNNIGFLNVLLGSELKLAANEGQKQAIRDAFNQIKTKQQAAAFMKKALTNIEAGKVLQT